MGAAKAKSFAQPRIQFWPRSQPLLFATTRHHAAHQVADLLRSSTVADRALLERVGRRRCLVGGNRKVKCNRSPHRLNSRLGRSQADRNCPTVAHDNTKRGDKSEWAGQGQTPLQVSTHKNWGPRALG